jgi:hypothetical protein
VLKKARKIANGKGHANLPMGAFVDTLVVQPDDLVQVIAKVGLIQLSVREIILSSALMIYILFFPQDLSLPIKGLFTAPECNVVIESGSLKPQVSHASDLKPSKSQNISLPKYVRDSN